ncbi:hypothetical protein [Clostridium thailandense]|uniref:hypothetical protein n=1 Tax=Clostridium thailandense TaxID=2794346 RepID=UPI003988B39C
MTRKIKKLLSAIFLFAVIISANGCSSGDSKEVTKQENVAIQTKELKSSDGKIMITVPKDWNDSKEIKSGNADFSIAVENKDASAYVGVISEAKTDSIKDVKLIHMQTAVIQQLKKSMPNLQVSDVKDIKINGFPAKSFECSGEMDKLKVKYEYAIIDCPNSFDQVLGWSDVSTFDKNKDNFTTIINSFKEVSNK